MLYFFFMELKSTGMHCVDVNYAMGTNNTYFPCFFDAENSTTLHMVCTSPKAELHLKLEATLAGTQKTVGPVQKRSVSCTYTVGS